MSNTYNYSTGSNIEQFNIDESDYGNFDNPLLQNGELKDYNGTPNSWFNLNFRKWGTGIKKGDRADLIAAFETSRATIESALIEAKAVTYDAFTKATAGIEAANIDAEARKYEADQNLAIAQGQQDTDREIAEMEREVELAKVDAELKAIDEVDAINAQANLRASDALVMEAGAKQTEADAELEKAKGKSSSSYIYDDPFDIV